MSITAIDLINCRDFNGTVDDAKSIANELNNKPTPATPAATPMAAPVRRKCEVCQSLGHTTLEHGAAQGYSHSVIPAATPLREANQQRVDAAAQRVRKALEKYRIDCTFRFRKDVELLIEIALAPVLEIFAAAQPQRESEIPAGLIEELDRQVHGNDSGWHACVLCGCPERGAHFPTCIVAKMRQRESEQPEQALREVLESSMVALDDWLNIHASDHCDEQRVKEALQRVNEHGTIHYIATVQDRNRAALSPQTDSQEPKA